MKIAYYLGSLNQGGTEALTLDICRNKRISTYEFLCIYRKGGSLLQDFINTGVQLSYNPCNRNIVRHIIRLRKCLRSEGVDIVHAQTPLCSLYAIIATIGTHINVVTSFHGTAFEKANNWFQKIVFNRSCRLIFVSHYIMDKYLKQCSYIQRNKCCVVYNGVSFDRILTKSISHDGGSTLRMGMVGSFRPERNQLFVCRFLKRLHDEGVHFHFDFVGPRCKGVEYCYDDCVQFCEDNGLSDSVSFLGGRSDVPLLLNQWDAYIYATHSDTFGISIVEAIASGLPTFVNDWPVAAEITSNGEMATIYRSEDVDDLFAKFMFFCNHKAMICENQMNNSKKIREIYSIKKHIQSLSEVYEQIMRIK